MNKGLHVCKPLCQLARPERFERPTPWFVDEFHSQQPFANSHLTRLPIPKSTGLRHNTLNVQSGCVATRNP